MTQRQSPIDIVRSGVVDGDLRLVAGAVGSTRTAGHQSDGVALPVLVANAHLIVDGDRFDLQSFHWHSPSEHLLDGKALPLELHLVHASPEGDLLVLGVLFTAGPEDAVIAPAFDTIDTVKMRMPA